MVQGSRAGTSRFAWSSILYLLLVFIAPMLMANFAAAEEAVDQGPVIGIDLGTTYSCVAVMKVRRSWT